MCSFLCTVLGCQKARCQERACRGAEMQPGQKGEQNSGQSSQDLPNIVGTWGSLALLEEPRLSLSSWIDFVFMFGV